MFCEHLADADDAALIRLYIVYMLWRHPFGCVSFLSSIFPAIKTPLILADDLENTFLARNTAFFLATIHKNATFYGQQPQKHHPIHEIARFYGQDDLRATNELPFQISRKWTYGFL